jgi:hypothetical protein
MAAAIFEGAAFFNLIAYLIEGQPFSPIAAAALLFFMMLQFPTAGRIEDWVERNIQTVDQMHAQRT